MPNANQSMKVELKKEEREKLEQEIQSFFGEELETPLNNLQVQLIIKFMTERFGAYFYGQGIRDARDFLQAEFQIMSENVLDLENDFSD